MATKGERQALLFLAAVAILGAGTRACRARTGVEDTSDLDRQIEAVADSRADERGPPRRNRGKRSSPAAAAVEPDLSVQAPPATPIDLDVVAAEDIERLPGIGPAIARRIIGDRNANGAFGCLQALDMVKGIGPALLRRLDSLVAFSGTPRPACASSDPPLRRGPRQGR